MKKYEAPVVEVEIFAVGEVMFDYSDENLCTEETELG